MAIRWLHLLAAVVWFFGPFISLLEGEVARAVVITVMLMLWAGINFWIDRRRRGRDEVLAKGVTETQDPGARPADPALVPAHSWAVLGS